MQFICRIAASSKHLRELRIFSVSWRAICVDVIKKVNNVCPLDCREVIWLPHISTLCYSCVMFLCCFFMGNIEILRRNSPPVLPDCSLISNHLYTQN